MSRGKGRGKGRHLVNEQYLQTTGFDAEAIKDRATTCTNREDVLGALTGAQQA